MNVIIKLIHPLLWNWKKLMMLQYYNNKKTKKEREKENWIEQHVYIYIWRLHGKDKKIN